MSGRASPESRVEGAVASALIVSSSAASRPLRWDHKILQVTNNMATVDMLLCLTNKVEWCILTTFPSSRGYLVFGNFCTG